MGIDGGTRSADVKPAIVAATSGTSQTQVKDQGGDRNRARAPRAEEKGRSPQDVQGAGAMPPADRATMIRGRSMAWLDASNSRRTTPTAGSG
jgi:hypothetical protein